MPAFLLALVEITPLHYAVFIGGVLVFLALDLGVFHRKAHAVTFREAFAWTLVFFTLAMGFAAALVPMRGRGEALEFVTGYIIELSLSMDNVFVIALIFAYFRVPPELQHRVLFWGILGALVMRGLMIWGGAVLVSRFHGVLYLFGGFLLFTGVKMLFVDDDGVHPEKNPVLNLTRRLYPVTREFEGDRFITRLDGRRALTPLALVLLMVETTDLVFAVDSIPAIFAVTEKPFIIFTSNVFAILGLRSLYFVLAGAIRYFRYLKIGLALVLAFIGLKMLVKPWLDIPTGASLLVVGALILLSVLLSILALRASPPADPPPPAA
ncbi:MAG: TerC family protein [Verrucomicrobia bacterium]|nr:TerC family protein [Verrucomicrobiota bacterium]